MKTLLLILIFILTTLLCISQTTYLKINNTPVHENPLRQYFDYDGNILITGANGATGFLPSITDATVWKFDIQGNLMNTYTFGHFSTSSYIIDIQKADTVAKTYLLTGMHDTIIDGNT